MKEFQWHDLEMFADRNRILIKINRDKVLRCFDVYYQINLQRIDSLMSIELNIAYNCKRELYKTYKSRIGAMEKELIASNLNK